MSIQLKKIQKAPTKFGIRCLLYGDPGAGKTFMIGTAQDVPEMGEVLVIDLDGGSSTLYGRDGISTAEVRKSADAESVLWSLVQKAPGYEKIRTVILDGASEMSKAELSNIAADAVKKGKRETADESQIQDFGILKNRLLRLFRMARDIPDMNVIISAWAKLSYPKGVIPGPDTSPTQISPDFSGAVSDALQGYVDGVWYLHRDKKTDKRTLVTAQHGVITAKTRGAEFANALGQTVDGKFSPTMPDPSFPAIVAAYKKAYNIK